MKIIRRIKAAIEKVPFEHKEWYNFMAHIPKEEYTKYSHIVCFDENGKYIRCPQIGSEVVWQSGERKYIYKIVGFRNQSAYSDWLYDSDYINPVIQFVRAIK